MCGCFLYCRGTYSLAGNILIDAEDSGVGIIGAQQPGHWTVLNRANTNVGSYVFELDDANDVTLSHLSITRAYDGVSARLNSDSDNLTVSNCQVYGNSNTGISLLAGNDLTAITNNAVFGGVSGPQANGIKLHGTGSIAIGNEVFDHSNNGVWLLGANSTISENTVYSNSGIGIVVSGAHSTINTNRCYGNRTGIDARGSGTTVSENIVHDNSSIGVQAYSILVSRNTVYGHDGTDDVGIAAYDTEARENVVYDNYNGITSADSYSTASIIGNRVFKNSNVGILAGYRSEVSGNHVYSNSYGIGGAKLPWHKYPPGFVGTIKNNLVYDNSDRGIYVSGSGGGLPTVSSHARIINNTVYQETGKAVQITGSANYAELRNNILWVEAGYAIQVSSDSQVGFNSDYNLFYRGISPDDDVHIGYFGGADQDLLSDWIVASEQDAESLESNPLFVDIDGADNVLGYSFTVGEGYHGGLDDNFYLLMGSPAVDRADSWATPLLDIAGAPHVDDLGTANQGSDDYFENLFESNSFALIGDPKNWHSGEGYWALELPCDFPFYGVVYTTVYVSSNGFLQFDTASSAGEGSNSFEKLVNHKRIAPCWDDLHTNGPGNDIYCDVSTSGQVTIRWDAATVADGNDINVSVTLYDTGMISFYYGAGNTNLTPTIGVSNGDERNYVLSIYDGQSMLTDANDLEFILAPGIKDIGAYEYLGGVDTIAPYITGADPEEIHEEGALEHSVDTIQILFSEPLNIIDARASSNYRLEGAGSNGSLGDGDDISYILDASYIAGASDILIKIVSGYLPADLYELTIFGDSTIHDLAGNRLDGDKNGFEGGNYVRVFRIDSSLPELTADINEDRYVDSTDYALLSSYWSRTDCAELSACNGADVDLNGEVNFSDLASFLDQWLWCNDPGNPEYCR